MYPKKHQNQEGYFGKCAFITYNTYSYRLRISTYIPLIYRFHTFKSPLNYSSRHYSRSAATSDWDYSPIHRASSISVQFPSNRPHFWTFSTSHNHLSNFSRISHYHSARNYYLGCKHSFIMNYSRRVGFGSWESTAVLFSASFSSTSATHSIERFPLLRRLYSISTFIYCPLLSWPDCSQDPSWASLFCRFCKWKNQTRFSGIRSRGKSLFLGNARRNLDKSSQAQTFGTRGIWAFLSCGSFAPFSTANRRFRLFAGSGDSLLDLSWCSEIRLSYGSARMCGRPLIARFRCC